MTPMFVGVEERGYGNQVLAGVARWARENGRLLSHLLFKHFDQPRGGVIIGQFADARSIEAARKRFDAVVNVSSRIKDLAALPVPSVVNDDHVIGTMAGEWIVRRGYRRAAFVGADDHSYSHQRLAGFRAVCEQAGLPVAILKMDATASALAAIVRPVRPVVVLCANDIFARSFIRNVVSKGHRVPEDFAVIGVDDDARMSSQSPVPISSIRINGETVGYRAAETAQRVLDGESLAGHVTRVPPVEVIARESTDVSGSHDAAVRAALAFITENAAKAISIDDVLESLVVSRRSLEIRFKQQTGLTLGQAIAAARMERAKQLLRETDLKMQDVAERAGFGSSTRLAIVFRRELGTTPTDYRSQWR